MTFAFAWTTSIFLLEGIAFDAKDVGPGVVFERNGVRITAIEVNHGLKITPSFGSVIEFDGKKVVPSGNTMTSASCLPKGADLLVHQVAMIQPELSKTYPSYKEVEDHYTSPEERGASVLGRRA
jgi:ribonuclease Z